MELAIGTNPIMKADFPDPDVIRVGDTYYMISTTMHFMPGGVILQSFDLIHWEIVSYVYEQLEDHPAHSLEQGESIYGQGMWAASLRFYKNTYYVLFSANDTKHSYLFQSKDILGPWTRKDLQEFYHDPSLLFDEDEKIYVVYGNTEIYIKELEKDSFLPKKGGLFRQIIKDTGNIGLGYEGSHMYKIHGNYYVFLIHWRKDGTRRRTQACYVSASLEGEFTGKEVLDDDMQYHNQGIAQGGIVDTPQGDWYAILFQDRGAVGRIPILLPLQWHKNFPVFGIDEKVPMVLKTVSTRPNHQYEPLCASDDFRYQEKEGQATPLKKVWQWNHNPNKEAWKLNPEKGILYLKTVKTSVNLLQASNCLTQRLLYPKCVVEVNIDGSDLKEGDIAGICALQSAYSLLGITKSGGSIYLVQMAKGSKGSNAMGEKINLTPGVIMEKKWIEQAKLRLRLIANFEDMDDVVEYQYSYDDQEKESARKWHKIGINNKHYFTLDHFVGCRVGLFIYSTLEVGGRVAFRDFEVVGNS